MTQRDVDRRSEPSWIPDGDGEHDQTLVETWLFRLRRERFRSRASGKSHDFFVAHLADGVHTIAVTAEQQGELVPLREIPPMIRAGRIDHAVCVAGLLWWLAWESVGRPAPVA